MAFQNAITIKKALENIQERKYLLPAIQRELVWKPEQMENLFDSILCGYPFGSFLFWDVKKENVGEYQFYEFIRNFHARDSTHNPRADVSGRDGLTAVLDGQQRLTALNIGLRGSYAFKSKWKRWTSEDAFPERRLHLNLLAALDELDRHYDFRFLTAEEAKDTDGNHWFPVSKVLEFTEPDAVFAYLVEAGISGNKFAGKCLFALHDALTKKGLITPFVEEVQSLDKVLQIFIRVNSAGTPLSYSDLLLSIATAQWSTRDARKEVHDLVDELNQIGQGFSFDKDFVMKACLVLAGMTDIRFKVSNFNNKNMEAIEAKWTDITKALRLGVSLVGSFGFNGTTLTSHNSVIPIAYYLLKRGFPHNYVESSAHKDDRKVVRHFLMVSLLKGVYGDQADTLLAAMRSAIDESHATFPVDGIALRLLKMNKSLKFEKEEVEDLLLGAYGQKQTFAVLSLLYPTLDYRNLFHQDHIHPQSGFTKRKLAAKGVAEESLDSFIELRDLLPNLQFLEGTPNQEKSDAPFADWFEKEVTDKAAFRERHYIPKVPLEIGNFPAFFDARKKLLFEKLSSMLGGQDATA